jgi:ABC-type transporter Mla subunit MlaD
LGCDKDLAMKQMSYKSRVKTTFDRGLFFSVVVVGIFGAIFLKSFSSSQSLQVWAPLIFDVVVLTAYAVTVMNVPLFYLRDDRAGDSFYYVGLLLTLGSLAHTLWQFGESQGDDSGATHVISGFGVALASTILGLALRVFVQHFRADPVEIEHHVRQSLNEASSTLTGELYSIVSELSGFRQSMSQIVEEGMKGTASSATAAMSDTASKFSTEVETLVNALDGIFDKLESSATSFTEVSKTTVSALSKLSTRIEKIEPPSNVVEFVFGPARDHMVHMAQTLTEAAEAQKDQIQRLGGLVTVSVQALSVLDATIASINTGATRSLQTFDAATMLAEKHKEILSEIGRLAVTLTESGSRQKESLSKIETALIEASRSVERTAEGLSDQQENALASVSAAIATFSDATSLHAREIGLQLESAREASGKLVSEMVSIADTVAEKLA